MGSGITRLLSPNQRSDLLHGLKISYHIKFPGRGTLPILTSGWWQFLSYEVLVVWRKHGIMFLSYFIVEGPVIWISSHFSCFVTQLFNALSNARRQRKRFIHIFFCEKWGRRKRTKRNPVTERWQWKVRKYFLDWFTPGKGPSIEWFLGRSNITIPPGQ